MATAAYQAAMTRGRDLVDAGLNLASVLAGQGRYEGAISVYAVLSGRHPSDGSIGFREPMVLPLVYRDVLEIDVTRPRVEAFLGSELPMGYEKTKTPAAVPRNLFKKSV